MILKVSDIPYADNWRALIICIINNVTIATGLIEMGLNVSDGSQKKKYKGREQIKKVCTWCNTEYYGVKDYREHSFCVGGVCQQTYKRWAAKGIYTLAERQKQPPTQKKTKPLICTRCGVHYDGHEQTKNGNTFCSVSCATKYHQAKRKAEKEGLK